MDVRDIFVHIAYENLSNFSSYNFVCTSSMKMGPFKNSKKVPYSNLSLIPVLKIYVSVTNKMFDSVKIH